jgi:hypothetical protein
MSRIDYLSGKQLRHGGWSTDALVFALIPQVQGAQRTKLKAAFPAQFKEWEDREANGGFSTTEAAERQRTEHGHSR